MLYARLAAIHRNAYCTVDSDQPATSLTPRYLWQHRTVSAEGVGLYQDDTGHDVRAEFREYIADGLSPEDATTRLEAGWRDVLGDEDVYCAFYLALADTQWRLGRVVPRVRETAISLIDSGRDMRRWEYSPPFHRKRQAVLEQLRKRLGSEPPAARAVRNPKVFRSELNAGDVIHYWAEDGQGYWIGILGTAEHNGARYAIAWLVNWDGSESNALAPPSQYKITGVGTFALMPYRGSDLPTKRSQVYRAAWSVPREFQLESVVGSSLLSWGSNLDNQLRHRMTEQTNSR